MLQWIQKPPIVMVMVVMIVLWNPFEVSFEHWLQTPYEFIEHVGQYFDYRDYRDPSWVVQGKEILCSYT